MKLGNFPSHNLATSPSGCTAASFSNSLTTSKGLVTCHLASVRLDGCPTAVVKVLSELSCSSTRGYSHTFPSAVDSTRDTDSGGSIVYGRDSSLNCKERNISSSVYRIKCQH